MKKYLIFLVLLCNFAHAGLPFDKDSKNIAVLFTMTDENGRTANLKMMENIFQDKTLGFVSQTHHNKSAPYIYEKITELSHEVGDYGTLLIYLNSHGGGGSKNFGMTAKDGPLKLSKVVQAVAKGNKVKRLIILIDTCHASGGIREGFQEQEIKIPTGDIKLPVLSEDLSLSSKEAYEEALIVASSNLEDLSVRGAFAFRLEKAFKAIKNKKDISTRDFFKVFSSLHADTQQKPHYKLIPNDNMLEEPLFENAPAREIPIVDKNNSQQKYPPDYIKSPN